MCPPSSCPIGSRLIIVTSSPAQPAYAIGCRFTSATLLGSHAPLMSRLATA